ncbi:hypothetical protein DFP72DRAFT_908900, partial [Ephemerocybe angulata]
MVPKVLWRPSCASKLHAFSNSLSPTLRPRIPCPSDLHTLEHSEGLSRASPRSWVRASTIYVPKRRDSFAWKRRNESDICHRNPRHSPPPPFRPPPNSQPPSPNSSAPHRHNALLLSPPSRTHSRACCQVQEAQLGDDRFAHIAFRVAPRRQRHEPDRR